MTVLLNFSFSITLRAQANGQMSPGLRTAAGDVISLAVLLRVEAREKEREAE